ncbi:MAG: aspartyl protease family protein [Bacteroidia bacterium]|nr:aspartyl protease family protein [Bacteroidia bacterium]
MIVTIPFGGLQQVEKEGKKILIPIHPGIALQNRGAIIPITITHPKSVAQKLAAEGNPVPSVRINALIDTGAFGTVITPKVAEALMLIQTGVQKVTSVQDEQERPAYYAYIQFHWGSGKEVPVVSCPLKGFDCLIGRDIMMHWNMTYNGKDGYIIICD